MFINHQLLQVTYLVNYQYFIVKEEVRSLLHLNIQFNDYSFLIAYTYLLKIYFNRKRWMLEQNKSLK